MPSNIKFSAGCYNSLKMQKKDNLKFATAFIAILFVLIYGSQEFYLSKVSIQNTAVFRYILYFGLITGVAIIGFLGLSNNKEPWLQQTWILVYLFCFILLLIAGITDLYIYPFSSLQKSYIQSFHLFFQSPAPLVIFFIFYKLSQRQKTGNRQIFKKPGH